MTSCTLADVAEQLRVSIRTVEQWIADRELRAVNVSRDRHSRKARLRVLQHDLDSFLAARATDATADRPPRRKRARLDVEQFV